MKPDKRLYDSTRWRKERKAYLADNPLCIMCDRQGRTTPATVVDHVVPHSGDEVLFWDRSNWQPLCVSCHSGIKRRQEHKGFSSAADVDGLPIDHDHPWNQAGRGWG